MDKPAAAAPAREDDGPDTQRDEASAPAPSIAPPPGGPRSDAPSAAAPPTPEQRLRRMKRVAIVLGGLFAASAGFAGLEYRKSHGYKALAALRLEDAENADVNA